MAKELGLESIKSKIEEIHSDYFYGGKKRKERQNFGLGILLGLGISFIVEALIDLISKNNEFNAIRDVFIEQNITETNFTGMDLIQYEITARGLLINEFHLSILLGIGILLTIFTVFVYIFSNKELIEHELKYSYKFNKNIVNKYTSKMLAVFFNFEEFFRKQINNNSNIKLGWSFNPKNNTFKIIVYHRFLRYFEGINIIFIDKNNIYLRFLTTKNGEYIGKNIIKTLEELNKKNILTTLKLKSRDNQEV